MLGEWEARSYMILPSLSLSLKVGVPLLHINEQGEPTASYIWTGWSSKFQEINGQIRGIYGIYLKLIKKTRKIPTCNQFDTIGLDSTPQSYSL